jgi:hypothetical protein
MNERCVGKRLGVALLWAGVVCSACEASDDGGGDAGTGGASAGGSASGGGAGAGGSGAGGFASGGFAEGGFASGGAGGAVSCETENLVPAPGLEACFGCLQASCCEALATCDQDPDCVYCIDNPLDTSERCIDMSNFSVKPNRRALDECETDLCTPPCGLDGGSSCSPGDCGASCPNFGSGCQ